MENVKKGEFQLHSAISLDICLSHTTWCNEWVYKPHINEQYEHMKVNDSYEHWPELTLPSTKTGEPLISPDSQVYRSSLCR